MNAYRALNRFRPGAPFKPWLLSIVANGARNRRKAAGRRSSLAFRAAAQGPSEAASPSPETAAVAAERRAELLLAVEGLGEADREAIAYRYFLVPEEIGSPDAVYEAGPEGVVLVYRARPGLPPLGNKGIWLILTELPGDVRSAYFSEGPRPYAGTEAVDVDGGRGYWARAESSTVPRRTGGLPTNVLLWEREGRALRLESGLPRAEAIRLAESVR